MVIYGIFGAGGFGREVMPVARSMLAQRRNDEDFELVFVVDDPRAESTNGQRVLSRAAFLASPAERKFFSVAIADTKHRERIVGELAGEGAIPFSIVAPNSLFLDGSTLGEGAIFCPFTMVTSNAHIGRHFHANIYSYVAHDCVIGDFVTFAPSVRCNGYVVIEDHVYVGTNAVIKPGSAQDPTVIGRGAVIGMGAVVTKSVPANAVVVGNPARPLAR